jgi:hypothetical protein
MLKKRYWCKIIGILLTALGIVLVILNLKGCFRYPERVAMVKMIQEKGQIPSDSPGFDSLIKRFPPPSTWSRKNIQMLAPGSGRSQGGMCVAVGPLIYFAKDHPPKAVCSFEEFLGWTTESRYPWIAVGMSVIGLLILIISFYFDIRDDIL